MAVKAPSLPAILTANALIDGVVLYATREGWTERLGEAEVARDADGLARLEAALRAAEAADGVIDPVLVPVALDAAGRIVPDHYRDRIRALGPTVRGDLGPQAAGEHRHVSL